ENGSLGDAADWGDVFTQWGTENSFSQANVYDSVQGALAVQKFLYLPDDPDGYPVVTMQLEQKLNDTVVQTYTQRWNSAEAAGEGDEPLTHVFTFENLPVYAPNGQRYTYSVTE